MLLLPLLQAIPLGWSRPWGRMSHRHLSAQRLCNPLLMCISTCIGKYCLMGSRWKETGRQILPLLPLSVGSEPVRVWALVLIICLALLKLSSS